MTELKEKKLAVILMMVLLSALALPAQSTGMEIMENVYNRSTGEDMTAKLNMILTNSRGSVRERSIAQYSRETSEGDQKVMFFLSPADVKDTSFMSWSYDDGSDDDQWIYLPALRRVKRISSRNKDDAFMGSDFTYDDLGERHPSEDRHSILREENYEGEFCYVIESVPNSEEEPYSRTVSWIAKDKWIGLKKEFYDHRGDLYKILQIDEFKKIDGYWVITDMIMEDLDREHSTRLAMGEIRFNNNLSDDLFTERQMKRNPAGR